LSSTFAALGAPTGVVDRLTARGIIEPFPIQAATVADALAGRDVCGKAPTGSGKTIAFGIPLVSRVGKAAPRRPKGLVLVPTRELAVQVAKELEALGASRDRTVEAVYGGSDMDKQIRKFKQGVDVVVATPGRLIDLLDRGEVRLDGVEIIVLDEADRMADMGFLPQVAKILRTVPKERQTMLFSATLDHQIMGLISQTQDPLRFEIEETQPTVEGLEHHLFEVHRMDKTDVLVSLLAGPHGSTLVFTRTKRECDRLAGRLKQAGINAEAIHGDLSQSDREKALKKFDTGKIDVLVATDVAARGLDIEGITLVVNYDPPEDHKAYVHRVGRTARAGRTGTAVTLATWEQRSDVERMARMLKLTPHIVEIFSTDPRLQQVGTAEMEGNQPAPEQPDRPATAGAYARLKKSRGPSRGGRRR
jgi:superfamily II DNA/RNA helicase